MSNLANIKPTTPSFVFGYWRPWKEGSSVIDSYLDYTKDVSLVKYGADTVGQYINQASKEQVQAINELGQAIGRGMNVLSNQMSVINQTLGFLNRNMDIQIEQQKLSNLLLQNIAELLRVPDSEKERQHSIELGIKFFVNASKDPDLFEDALESLLKAESLMKQDYFVLHRIGCIYLYVEKYINPELALDYFLRAAKYACVESDPKANRLVNILGNNLILNDFNSTDRPRDPKPKLFNLIIKRGKINLSVWNNVKSALMDVLETSGQVNNNQILVESKNQEYIDAAVKGLLMIEEQGGELQIIETNDNANKITGKDLSDDSQKTLIQIGLLAADSYEKAGFAAYVLGRFEDAVNYQSKALKFNSTSENRFILSKYQVRNNNIKEAIANLDISINDKPIYAIAAFKELDLINEPEVIKLIAQKNDAIDNKIKQLAEKWKIVESTKVSAVIKELTELSQKSYEIKIEGFNKYEEKGNTINTGITELEANIDAYIDKVKQTTYCTFDADKIQAIINELHLAKDLPLEKMQVAFDKLKKETDADNIKIGSKYAGGIVIHLDKTGIHGLVCADKDFGNAIWGGNGEIGANGNGIADGSGMANTKKIVELASWNIEKGWLSSTKTPVPTAARLCLESVYNGFSDWYLPTETELNVIYKNKDKIGGLANNSYWSSTESSNLFVCVQVFSHGRQNGGNKTNSSNVRAVRVF